MDFKEAIKMPLHLDECGCYVWSSDYQTVFTCLSKSRELLELIVKKLNKESEHKFDAIYKNEMVYINGKATLLVRGWGYLTGTGGLNLSPDVAAKIQDDFCEWCVRILRI